MDYTNFGTFGFANSIRPLSVHDVKEAILLLQRVQKLGTQMNVELVAVQEVFEQHANRIAS